MILMQRFLAPLEDHQWLVEQGGPNHLFSKTIFNTRFVYMFVNRMVDQLNSAFKTDYLLKKLNEMHSAFLPEIDEHIGRWKSPLTKPDWELQIQGIRNFIIQRPSYQKQIIMLRYGVDTIHYQLNVSDETKGYITINTLDIDKKTKGLADSTMPYPWTGTYFKNNSC